MSKEEYERKRNTIRRVVDPETGRSRLIRGEGEVLEEIVSRDRHKEINKVCMCRSSSPLPLLTTQMHTGWGTLVRKSHFVHDWDFMDRHRINFTFVSLTFISVCAHLCTPTGQQVSTNELVQS